MNWESSTLKFLDNEFELPSDLMLNLRLEEERRIPDLVWDSLSQLNFVFKEKSHRLLTWISEDSQEHSEIKSNQPSNFQFAKEYM